MKIFVGAFPFNVESTICAEKLGLASHNFLVKATQPPTVVAKNQHGQFLVEPEGQYVSYCQVKSNPTRTKREAKATIKKQHKPSAYVIFCKTYLANNKGAGFSGASKAWKALEPAEKKTYEDAAAAWHPQ